MVGLEALELRARRHHQLQHLSSAHLELSGGSIALCGFLYALFLVVHTLFCGVDVPGYASIMVVTLTLGGLILLSLGIIGEYLGRIFEEVKRRSLFIVRQTIGFADDGATPAGGRRAPLSPDSDR